MKQILAILAIFASVSASAQGLFEVTGDRGTELVSCASVRYVRATGDGSSVLTLENRRTLFAAEEIDTVISRGCGEFAKFIESRTGDTLAINVNIIRSVASAGAAITTIQLAPSGTVLVSGSYATVSAAVEGCAVTGGVGGTDDQKIDTFDIAENALRISLEGDGEPYKWVDLSTYLPDGNGVYSGSGIMPDNTYIQFGNNWYDAIYGANDKWAIGQFPGFPSTIWGNGIAYNGQYQALYFGIRSDSVFASPGNPEYGSLIYMDETNTELSYSYGSGYVDNYQNKLVTDESSVFIQSQSTLGPGWLNNFIELDTTGIVVSLNTDVGTSGEALISDGAGKIAWGAPSVWTTSVEGGGGLLVDSTQYVTVSGTDQNIAIIPAGNGGFMLAAPDSTTVGGNPRGNNAVDLQIVRDAATQVAKGHNSLLAGGSFNTVSGSDAVGVGGNYNSITAANTAGVGGTNNTVSATSSAILGGSYNTITSAGTYSGAVGCYGCNISNQWAFASGQLAEAYVRGQVAQGSNTDAQGSSIVLSDQITGTTTTEIFAGDVSNQRIVLTNGSTNRAYNAIVQAVAVCTSQGNGTVTAGEVYTVTKACAIKSIGGTTALVGAVQTVMTEQEDTNMAGADCVVSADDASDSLKIEFTPPTAAGSTSVFKVSVFVRLAEIGY